MEDKIKSNLHKISLLKDILTSTPTPPTLPHIRTTNTTILRDPRHTIRIPLFSPPTRVRNMFTLKTKSLHTDKRAIFHKITTNLKLSTSECCRLKLNPFRCSFFLHNFQSRNQSNKNYTLSSEPLHLKDLPWKGIGFLMMLICMCFEYNNYRQSQFYNRFMKETVIYEGSTPTIPSLKGAKGEYVFVCGPIKTLSACIDPDFNIRTD